MLPEAYEQYLMRRLGNGLEPESNVAKFAARYKFAGQLDDIKLLDSSPKRQKAYLLCLRLSLAYSAFEQLQSVLQSKHVPITSLEIAGIYRRDTMFGFREFLKSESNSGLIRELVKFEESAKDANLNPVVRALRNSMFHGALNPSRANVTTESALEFLERLDKHLFVTMNLLFASWVDGLE